MRGLLAILRYAFISPEFLVCLSGIAVYNFFPGQLVWLSGRIGDKAELLKYLGLLPFGLVAYDSNVIRDILMPHSDKKIIFQKWEFYADIKWGCIVALLYAVLFGVVGCACLLFDWKAAVAYQSGFLLTSIVGALTVSASLYFTHIKIEELFRQHSSQSS